MRTYLSLFALAFAVWMASGVYVVRGNEQGVVRRFGRALPAAVGSGLHYDLPWPLTRIDRVNQLGVRTLTIGVPAPQGVSVGGFLQEIDVDRQAEFLTGDKNILNLQLNVQYVITDPAKYVFACEAPDLGLKLLAEATITDAIARSGVDFVHPLGLNELREFLTRQLQQSVGERDWGLTVEEVTVAGVFPPVEVKSAFLDVSNARAEMDRMIQEEQTRSEQLQAAAQATSAQTRTQAETDRQSRISAAKGSADRFRKVLAQFKKEAESGKVTYAAVRQMTLQRLYAATLEQVLPKLSGKVFLDGGKPVDLTIWRKSP